jgi:hypothetical protein
MKIQEAYYSRRREKVYLFQNEKHDNEKDMKMRYFFGFILLLMGHEALGKDCRKPCPAVSDCSKPCPTWWEKGWAATLFSGPLTSQTSSKIFGNGDFGHSGIVALAGSKKLGSVWGNRLDFELEAQAVQHFGDQKHFELNPVVILARWRTFPWNHVLPTTFAIGDGISIATETPKLEVKKRGRKGSSKVLNYVMAELTLSLPPCPKWALVARYHHRSGMFGVFNGVHDASTAFALGVKYWF